MPFAAALSRHPDLDRALGDVCNAVSSGMNGAVPDLAFVFVSHEHSERLDEIPAAISRETGAAVVLGCTGETVVGGDEEVESGPAVSLWAAALPVPRPGGYSLPACNRNSPSP